jgi:hypothetical protein
LVEISIYTNQSKDFLGCGEGALTLENGKYPSEYIYIYNRNKILLRILFLQQNFDQNSVIVAAF